MANEGTLTGLKSILFMMLFYSVCVTLIAHFAPSYTTPYTGDFTSQGINTDMSSIANQVDLGVQSQTQLPLADIGALLFYSGNLFIDLAVNFFTALPQMTVLLINIILSLISPDAVFSQQLKLVFEIVFFVSYMLGLISLLLNLRSGKGVGVI